jgi:NDP-sugar pyrophosphorylase family protein
MLPVAILAGGLATRLRPLTEKIPKALLEVAGRPFIHWQLELLKSAGVNEVVLCTGYLGEMIEQEIGDGHGFGLNVQYSADGDRLRGTGGALRIALDLLGDEFFVLYGDSYLPVSFSDVETAYRQGRRQGLMTVFRNEGKWDASNVWFEQGIIREYNKKERSPQMHHIDYGLSIMSRGAFEPFAAQEVFDLAEVFADLLRRDQLAGCEVFQRFYEIGSHSGIEELEAFLRDRSPKTH